MQLQYKIISFPGKLDALIRDFIAANDDDFYPTIASRRDLSDFVQSVYQAKGRYVICFDGEKIAGLTSVYLDHPSFITYYHYIAIDKNYRGKGISTTLYNYVHEICKEYGVQWAIVKTWSTNQVSQAMFKKHGFFHLYTIEDDRSKGVHTYFYAKSFSADPFGRPVSCIAMVGNNSYALGNFTKTISSIPRICSMANGSLPFFVVNNFTDSEVKAVLGNNVSHVLFLGGKPSFYEGDSKIELIHLNNITKKLVEERKKKWLLVGDLSGMFCEPLVINNLLRPAQREQERISEIATEIRTGKVSPAYYRNEIAAMASSGGHEGIVLGSPELHTMFNFDKMFNGVEIFDPWLELAILVQNNRMNFKLS